MFIGVIKQKQSPYSFSMSCQQFIYLLLLDVAMIIWAKSSLDDVMRSLPNVQVRGNSARPCAIDLSVREFEFVLCQRAQ